MFDDQRRTIIIPVRFRDGRIQDIDGGVLPRITDCVADLVMPEYAIEDEEIRHKLQEEKSVEIQPAGAELLVVVRPKTLGPTLTRFVRSPDNVIPKSGDRFVPIMLQTPLILCLRGTKSGRLEDCKCLIPAIHQEARSVNHAYTLISQVFELARRSHTGNIFELCY